jgi:lipid II isoglutaminyl synthase (glutamine-hydrolysing)
LGNYSLTQSDRLAVFLGKLSASLIRSLSLGMGSNLPGRFARRLSPRILHDLSSQPRLGSLAVTGTNGKSTTAGLLSSILRTVGYKLVHNRQGANLVTGITASLVDAAHWSGRIDADYAIFEIDEAALPVVAQEVNLKSVVVTNLFRDQLDRFGELDTTAKLIAQGVQQNHSAAILNADDPNVAQLTPAADSIYFGIDTHNSPQFPSYQPAELAYCARCGAEVSYEFKTYGQLGKWFCTECEQARPALDVYAKNVQSKGAGSTFDLHHKDYSTEIELALPGLFNVYNAIAASAMAFSLGITIEAIKDGLKEYTTLFGRSEKVSLQGKPVIIQLIKNPAGASQTVQAVVQEPDGKVLIAINDNYADGRDVSWLWDANFEPLVNVRSKFTVSGRRAEDMALRLKYAGISESQIEVLPSLLKALESSVKDCRPGQTLWILPTYTCLLELQKILKKAGVTLADS